MDLRKKTDKTYDSFEYEVRDSDGPQFQEDIGGFDMDNDLSNDQPSDIERINRKIDSNLSDARTLCIIMSLVIGAIACSVFTPIGLAVIIGGVLAAQNMKKGAVWARSVCAVISVLNGLLGIMCVAVGISMISSGELEKDVSAAVMILLSLFLAVPVIALIKMYASKYVRDFFYRNKRR